MELLVHHRGAGEMAAELGPLLLRVVNGVPTTHESVDLLAALLERLAARWPMVGVLVAVEHGSPNPALDVGRRVDAELRRYAERLVIGYAFLGLGFWSFDARGFAAERAATLGVPVIVETSVRGLATRASLELVGVDPELIVRSFAQLRSELGLPSL